MKRITIYVDEGTHEDLFDLAAQHGVSVSELARCAIIEFYEDDLDRIAGEKGLREHLEDPDSAISFEALRAKCRRLDEADEAPAGDHP